MFETWIFFGLIGLAALLLWLDRASRETVDHRSPGREECRAEAYMLAHDFQGALAEAEKAIQSHPHDALNYFHRANAHQALGNLEQAVADYTTAIEVHESETSEVCGQCVFPPGGGCYCPVHGVRMVAKE